MATIIQQEVKTNVYLIVRDMNAIVADLRMIIYLLGMVKLWYGVNR